MLWTSQDSEVSQHAGHSAAVPVPSIKALNVTGSHNKEAINVIVKQSADSKKLGNPLRNNNGKFVVFAKMISSAIWKFYLYGEEAKSCRMPNNITCLFTNDSSYYTTADVLFINECKHPCIQPAYQQQLVLRYNHEAERKNCNNSLNIKLADTRISYTLSSTIPYPYLCRADVKQQLLEAFQLKPPTNRHGIAMFISNCPY